MHLRQRKLLLIQTAALNGSLTYTAACGNWKKCSIREFHYFLELNQWCVTPVGLLTDRLEGRSRLLGYRARVPWDSPDSHWRQQTLGTCESVAAVRNVIVPGRAVTHAVRTLHETIARPRGTIAFLKVFHTFSWLGCRSPRCCTHSLRNPVSTWIFTSCWGTVARLNSGRRRLWR